MANAIGFFPKIVVRLKIGVPAMVRVVVEPMVTYC